MAVSTACLPAVWSAAWTEWVSQVTRRLLLPDFRLVRRARDVLTVWATRPGASLAKACATRAQAKAAYNFIANPRVPSRALGQAVYGQGSDLCAEHSRVFVAQDTTTLTYGNRADTEGLGPVTTSGAQGLLVHTSLALAEQGVPLGLLDQQIWTRPHGKRPHRDARPIEDKESAEWLRGLQAARDQLPQEIEPVFLSDSEGDVHEVFALAKDLDVGLVVRAAQNRRVREAERKLFEATHGSHVALTPHTPDREGSARGPREDECRCTCAGKHPVVVAFPGLSSRAAGSFLLSGPGGPVHAAHCPGDGRDGCAPPLSPV